jgi:hypothetical protein
MPFKSKAQQGFLFAKKPEIAKEFASKMSPADFSKLPDHVRANSMRKAMIPKIKKFTPPKAMKY